ncbi:hypothetical protein IVB15_17060 [Bradyrhizobium sp. 182]|uniref:hypothetical protein n=1 Tax=unclassified Bradyrhizobium TaxID=2631580 RepID=UPI001FF73038|nr:MULTISPECIES: hypothetical protein [unclassified Bradyrhizobium]MCK1423014.1 hypothetical protein [Bradyrhizobium sp. CW12]MCK1529381.1 hypothetical protein [Bradyrhizobium sp. 182]MCK1643781.1 hypothetical protein [Bradyrhizobium sp. 154]
MLDGLAACTHRVWILVEPRLRAFENVPPSKRCGRSAYWRDENEPEGVRGHAPPRLIGVSNAGQHELRLKAAKSQLQRSVFARLLARYTAIADELEEAR